MITSRNTALIGALLYAGMLDRRDNGLSDREPAQTNQVDPTLPPPQPPQPESRQVRRARERREAKAARRA